ncbi:MAG: HAMP domain-containing protein [Phycisphaeraceae bacterium]|nr:HAMP domain-containing protein [Phycisphaeraceae bacterium]
MLFNLNSIKNRITLAFLTVSMILVAVSALGIYQVIALQRDYIATISERFPQMYSMSQLASKLSAMEKSVVFIAYDQTDDEANDQAVLAKFEAVKTAARERVRVNIQIAEDFGEDDEFEMLEALSSNLDHYILLLEEMIHLHHDQTTETDQAKADHMWEKLYDTRAVLNGLIDEVIEEEYEELLEGQETSERGSARSMLIGVAAATLALGAALLLGWGVSRSINRPLSELQQAAGRFGQGDLDARVGGQHVKEFGLLADTFNQMAIDLKAVQAERDRAAEDLLQVSRQAGMAEVATGVLHNVGNVLNSVNVSAGVVTQTMERSRLGSLGKLAGLLTEEKDRLGEFVSSDPRGQCLPEFIDKLYETLEAERGELESEISQLVQGVEHIKEVVRLQQVSAASGSNVMAPMGPADLMEQAATVNLTSFERHEITLVRDYESSLPKIRLEKHKTLQILINLISNGKKAVCDKSVQRPAVTLRLYRDQDDEKIVFEVSDNGIGIEPDQLPQVFQHGYSTFKNGHGFGLHSAVCAAGEMGGELTAHSDGRGAGATFRLSLPMVTEGEVLEVKAAKS